MHIGASQAREGQQIIDQLPHALSLGADYRADDWTHTQGSLFSAMKLEKTMIGLLLLMIVAVAAFNIIATLIMVVNDKGADIAILRTIGATPGQIMTIFMVQGTVIGIVGTIIGGVLGVIAAINVSEMVAKGRPESPILVNTPVSPVRLLSRM